jgi:hypothetical protein
MNEAQESWTIDMNRTRRQWELNQRSLVPSYYQYKLGGDKS